MTHLPVNMAEAHKRGWDELDVIFVFGDAYIDHPAFGVPLLARWLEAHGFRVGIIPQPDWRSREAFMVLGRPRLFFAVAAGAMDSMVAHYTPRKKLRHDDAYTPGNRHGARPNRATIVYTGRIREAYRDIPVVIGGVEASLRRLAHYDYWDDKVRRSILLDSKADLLCFGMAEQALLEVARRMRDGESMAEIRTVRGTAFVSPHAPQTAVRLPSFEEVAADPAAYVTAFCLAEKEQNPWCGQPLVQAHANRQVVCLPPPLPLDMAAMDAIYSLPFCREPHPSYREPIPAFEQIRLSVTTHRGCFGGCAFCAIAGHQGKFIQSRSHTSIMEEVSALAQKRWFSGALSDLGGPTANMYGLSCGAKDGGRQCRRPGCLFPAICPNLQTDDRAALEMLKKVATVAGVKNITVSSGIRHDLLASQDGYFRELLAHHTGGLLKVAPEHLAKQVLSLMRKPDGTLFERFLCRFREENRRLGKRQGLVPYLMSGHPGCTLEDMVFLAKELKRLGLRVEQVQEFTPTPGTAATCMYHTGINPETGEKIHVARSDREKILQKGILLWHLPEQRQKVRQMLQKDGRGDLLKQLQKL